MSTISDLNTATITMNFDMEKATQKYEKSSSNFIALGQCKDNGKSLKIYIEGELITHGIAENKFNNSGKSVTSYSLGVSLEDPTVLFLDELTSKVGIVASIFPGESYTISNPVKDDVIYLKVKDKKTFKDFSNVKPEGLVRGQKVKVLLDVKFYVNLKDSKAGLTLQPLKYEFEL